MSLTKRGKRKFAQWIDTRLAMGSPMPRSAGEGLDLLRSKFDPKFGRPRTEGRLRRNHVRKMMGLKPRRKPRG